MCTHPGLAPEAASALAPRLVLGVSTRDLARLFLVPEPTVAARITRAKKKIVAAGTAGCATGSGPDLLRADLAGEAVRLVRVMCDLRPGEPTPTALLALMLLQHSRRDARVDDDGRLVLLADQDHRRWRHDEVEEALTLLADLLLTGPLTPLAASYVVQTRIAAEHATAAAPEATRWHRIVGHDDQLLQIVPSPSARLSHAVAVAAASGPEAGLAALSGVEMPGSHRVAAVRAELLVRAGETARGPVGVRRGDRRVRQRRRTGAPGRAPPCAPGRLLVIGATATEGVQSRTAADTR